MKRRMETLIRIQSIQKDLKSKELRRAKEASIAAQNAYQRTKETINQTKEDFGNAQHLGLDRDNLALYENYLKEAQNMLQQEEETLAQLEEMTEERRESLNQTFKVLKIYEKYDETLSSRYEAECKQREAKELDERAIQGNKKSRE